MFNPPAIHKVFEGVASRHEMYDARRRSASATPMMIAVGFGSTLIHQSRR
jgi:hypothetical protein